MEGSVIIYVAFVFCGAADIRIYHGFITIY